jgi:predicted ATPase
MIQRIYVHNFRCLENFELKLGSLSSVLLIGKNGSGKSTLRLVLEILQSIARQSIGQGENRVGKLVDSKDFACGRSNVPMRFEIEVLLNRTLYKYELALELPAGFKELRVLDEQLTVAGIIIFSRKNALVHLRPNRQQNQESKFLVDWHLIALPVIQQSEDDPIHMFRTWLARAVILSPIPQLVKGESKGETLEPKSDGSNFAEWFAGLLSRTPAAYTQITDYLRQVLPDIEDFQNQPTGKDSKNLVVRFREKSAGLSVDFFDLSDGEKCFFLCAAVLATNRHYGPIFCFWDEPDSHLSVSEVGHFVAVLRQAFTGESQILVSSHNPEAIRKFSNENTFVLNRRSHLEPTTARSLQELDVKGDLVDALIRGDAGNELQ